MDRSGGGDQGYGQEWTRCQAAWRARNLGPCLLVSPQGWDPLWASAPSCPGLSAFNHYFTNNSKYLCIAHQPSPAGCRFLLLCSDDGWTLEAHGSTGHGSVCHLGDHMELPLPVYPRFEDLQLTWLTDAPSPDLRAASSGTE